MSNTFFAATSSALYLHVRVNGCHNRKPFAKVLMNQDGWRRIDGVRHMVKVPQVMSPTCEYTKSSIGQADAGCLGCRHRSTNPPQGKNRT